MKIDARIVCCGAPGLPIGQSSDHSVSVGTQCVAPVDRLFDATATETERIRIAVAVHRPRESQVIVFASSGCGRVLRWGSCYGIMFTDLALGLNTSRVWKKLTNNVVEADVLPV